MPYRTRDRKDERMNREQATREVQNHLADYLEQYHGITDTKKKFSCLNPEHEDNNPSANYYICKDGIPRVKCFGCGENLDIFDLIQRDFNLNPSEAFRKGYAMYGIQIDSEPERALDQSYFPEDWTGQTQSFQGFQNQPAQAPQGETIKELDLSTEKFLDLTDATRRANSALMEEYSNALEYIKGRGISEEIIQKYQIGFDPLGLKRVLAENPEYSPKDGQYFGYIFPILDNDGKSISAIAEATDRKTASHKYAKILTRPDNAPEITQPLFNERYLSMEQPPEAIFITEGIYDALSIETVGGHAIALMGTAHNRLLSAIKTYRPETKFIVALDDDGPGMDNQNKLLSGLAQLGYATFACTYDGHGKDPNEFLQENESLFRFFIEQKLEKAKEIENPFQIERNEYRNSATGFQLQNFVNEIEKNRNLKSVSTGFNQLDEALDGGFFKGLYIIGAISSLGKTTFCLQLMDQIAQTGRDVLIFALEMSTHELMAKSISRETLYESLKTYGNKSCAKTVRGITSGSALERYSRDEMETLQIAMNNYEQYAKHIFIHSGIGSFGINEVKQEIEHHVQMTGNRPVVLIDYLQILAPYDVHMTDKQNTDKAVLELKRISEAYQIPVVAISSFNRESYGSSVSMASFKESGAIEYSSDVLIGLQYYGMDSFPTDQKGDRARRIEEITREVPNLAKQLKPVRIQIKVLKNRNGSKGTLELSMVHAFNCFYDPYGEWGKYLNEETILKLDDDIEVNSWR